MKVLLHGILCPGMAEGLLAVLTRQQTSGQQDPALVAQVVAMCEMAAQRWSVIAKHLQIRRRKEAKAGRREQELLGKKMAAHPISRAEWRMVGALAYLSYDNAMSPENVLCVRVTPAGHEGAAEIAGMSQLAAQHWAAIAAQAESFSSPEQLELARASSEAVLLEQFGPDIAQFATVLAHRMERRHS